MSRLRVLSLGAGVQSTTLALMAAAGEIEAPHDAIFADTGAEPAAVYRHLEWLMQPGLLPFPVHIVKWRDLADDLLHPPNSGFLNDTMLLPAHQKPAGQLRRYCTTNYKTGPIVKKLNELRRGLHRHVDLLLGISTDEADRMKPAPEKWLTRRYPLIERGYSRTDCRSWLFKRGYPQPPKSSCVFCPYKSEGQWRDMSQDSADWQLACDIDDAIRANFGIEAYVHRSLQPLRTAPLGHEQGDLFSSECEGYCGV